MHFETTGLTPRKPGGNGVPGGIPGGGGIGGKAMGGRGPDMAGAAIGGIEGMPNNEGWGAGGGNNSGAVRPFSVV